MHWTFRIDTVILTSSFQGRPLVYQFNYCQINNVTFSNKVYYYYEEIEKKVGFKNSRRSNLFYLVAFNTVFWSSGSPRKLWNENEDFELHVHLLPCLQINNSNVAFALFTSALKLIKTITLSITAEKQKTDSAIQDEQASHWTMQCTEPSKRHGYSHFLISRKKLEKNLVVKTPDAQISSIW